MSRPRRLKPNCEQRRVSLSGIWRFAGSLFQFTLPLKLDLEYSEKGFAEVCLFVCPSFSFVTSLRVAPCKRIRNPESS